MSVIRLEIIPICFWVSFILLVLVSPSGILYDLESKSTILSNPFVFLGSTEAILTFPLLSCVGIHITVSPSKSAPESLSATLLLIHIASVASVPKSFLQTACLLLTVTIGISNVPP